MITYDIPLPPIVVTGHRSRKDGRPHTTDTASRGSSTKCSRDVLVAIVNHVTDSARGGNISTHGESRIVDRTMLTLLGEGGHTISLRRAKTGRKGRGCKPVTERDSRRRCVKQTKPSIMTALALMVLLGAPALS